MKIQRNFALILIFILPIVNAETSLSLDEQYSLNIEYPMEEVNGNIIYSRYDKTGNSKEIISFNPLTKKEAILVRGEHDASFVAENDGYIAYFDHRYDRPASPLIFYSKNDSKIVGKIKLSMYPYTSFLNARELVVVEQGGGVSEPTTHAAFFALPDLKFKKQVEISGDGTAISIDNNFISLGREKVYIYDAGMNQIRSDALPKESLDYRNCSPRQIFKISASNIAFTNCYDLYVYNLKNYEVKKILSMEGFYIFASDGKYIYAFPTDVNAHLKAKTYRVSDNKTLDEFIGVANYVFVKEGKLIVVDFEKNKFAKISVFSLKLWQ